MRTAWAHFALVIAGYVLFSAVTWPVAGYTTLMFCFLPPVAVAWGYGPRRSLLASLGVLVVDGFFVLYMQPPFVDAFGFAVGHLVGAGAGLATARVAALVRAQRRAQRVFEVAGDALFLVRLGDAEVLDANPEAERLTGFSLRELSRDLPFSGVAVDWPWSLPSSGEALETALRTKTGQEVPVSVHISPLQEGKDDRVWVISARDLTHAKKIEAQLLEAEHARGLAAANKQLQRANRLAQMGTMSAGVGHEINNPLTFVLANVEYLQQQVLPSLAGHSEAIRAELEEVLAEVELGGRRIGQVVSELKGFSRVENSQDPHPELSGVLEDAARMARHAMGPAVDFEPRLQEGLRSGVDPGRLGQVVINLLTNAAHAVSGCPEPRILLRSWARGDYAYIEVIDNGAGIAPEHLGRILDPFFTTKPIGEGTGLGLSVCSSILEEMGARLEVESTVGRGATFRIRLPRVRDPQQRTPTPRVTPPWLAGLSVLVVDDEQPVTRALGRSLPEVDFITAHSGPEALERLRDHRPDVVLCDLMMPGVSGMELYRTVLAEDPALAARFIFFTGGAIGCEARTFCLVNQDRMLSKPLDIQQLKDAISRGAVQPTRAGGPCPNIQRCPVFPRLQAQLLSAYQLNYCSSPDGAHQRCQRYCLMSSGQRPEADLLPDGERLGEELAPA